MLRLNETEIDIVQPRTVAVRCPCDDENCTTLVAVGANAYLARLVVRCGKIFSKSSFWPAVSTLRAHVDTMRCIGTREDPRLSNANW